MLPGLMTTSMLDRVIPDFYQSRFRSDQVRRQPPSERAWVLSAGADRLHPEVDRPANPRWLLRPCRRDRGYWHLKWLQEQLVLQSERDVARPRTEHGPRPPLKDSNM